MFPKEVEAVLRALEAAGHRAYAVGGCVRDLLRGETPDDYDITTSARPEEVKAENPSLSFRAVISSAISLSFLKELMSSIS